MSADGNSDDKDEMPHFWKCKSAAPPPNFIIQPRFFSQQFDSNFHNKPPEHVRLNEEVQVELLHIRELEFKEIYRKSFAKFVEKQDEDEELKRAMQLAVVAALNAEADVKRAIKLEHPPGHHLIGVLRAVLPKKVYDRVYGQMVADSWEEYYDAIAQGDHSEAKKIKRYLNYCLFMSVVEYLSGLPFHFVSKCVNLFDKSE